MRGLTVWRYRYGGPSPLHDLAGTRLRHLHHGAVVDLTDDDIPDDVLDLAAAPVVAPADALRHRANVVRLWVLHERGGWWADSDLLPVRPFYELPSPATAGHAGRGRCSCWLAFPAGHPVLAAALNYVADAPPSTTAASREVSGEALLDDLCGSDVARLDLPWDAVGQRTGGELWADHLFANHTGVR